MKPFLSLEDIAIRLHERVSFAGTSWVIGTGEQWAIVGSNGSGKSTLAAALASQVPLLRGRIRYHFLSVEEAAHAEFGWFPRGSVVRVGPEDHRRLAERYSGYHQARWHAGEAETGETVAALLTRQSVEAINPYQVLASSDDAGAFDLRRARAVELFGLAPLLGHRVKQLSSGETRKLLLARAVARGPRLLILDDPFDGLDASFRATLRGALDALTRDGLQLVIATSRPEDLPASVDRAIVVEQQRVAAKLDRAGFVQIARRSAAPPRGHSPERSSVALSRRGGPAPGEPLVEMRGVSVKYQDVTALDRVDFRLCRGEHWALLGPNGAGKTTLLSVLLADHPQGYSNDVRLFGRRRGSGESIWDIKARVGWVSPEIHAHHPGEARCLDVVCSGFFASVGLYHSCTSGQMERARAALGRLGVAGVAQRELGELSSGLQRLVLVARALVATPELLVLDEPCQGLDAVSRARVLEGVDASVRSGGTSVIFVTHHQDELPACITHVLELSAGRVVRSGPRG